MTKRLEDATNSLQALEWIIADLRAAGHEVTLWDRILSDAWTAPDHDRYLWMSSTRILTMMRIAKVPLATSDGPPHSSPSARAFETFPNVVLSASQR
ncbi:hypothetical protein AKJ09_04563 [Labilithrix luteola]|uniref:Uncharacterized protein n=1 Tax=Labilithrix luteola TaxID=1391654 RepID=A0A0K1PXM8_9BACT|nr:hypothetical protein AKJ09_04563 [Labilithrix luteola]